MDRLDLDRAYAPLPPITWPGGGEQAVKRLTWRVEEMVAELADADAAQVKALMPKIMTALLPGRSWDEIADTLSSAEMKQVIQYASGAYKAAQAELESVVGNGVAGAGQPTVPASPPPSPPATSSPASPANTAVPCGAS